MKKLFSIILLGFTVLSFAQGDSSYKHRKSEFTAEQQATLQTKQMVLELDLNESQQKQLLSLTKKRAQVREKYKAEHKAMKESEKTPSQDEKFKMKNEMLDMQIAHQASMKKILNDQQYKQWRVYSKKMQKMKKHKMQKMMKHDMHKKRMHHDKM